MEEKSIHELLMDIPTVLCRGMSQRFVNTVLKDVQRDLSQHHFMILKLLVENEQLYVSEIVSALHITKPQMTASIDRLVKMDYVERHTAPNDRRKIYLSITNEGAKITQEIKKQIDTHINDHLQDFSEQEIHQLKDGLQILFKFCSTY